MKLSELVKDEKYGNLEVRIESLFNTDGSLSNVSRVSIEIPNELLLPKKPKTIYDLEFGDAYWCIGKNGAYSYEEEWYDDTFDTEVLAIGNIFLTKEEAEFELECRKVYQELKRFSKEFEPKKSNWYIFFSHRNQEGLRYDYNEVTQATYLFFESREKAQEAVNSVGEDRVIKYYLGVKD